MSQNWNHCGGFVNFSLGDGKRSFMKLINKISCHILKLLIFLLIFLPKQIIEALFARPECVKFIGTRDFRRVVCFSWLLYGVIKPLYALLSSAENWPKKDFCRLYRTLNLWNWVNCVQLMCYSSRSSEVWITLAESAAFTPRNFWKYLWKWKGAFWWAGMKRQVLQRS